MLASQKCRPSAASVSIGTTSCNFTVSSTYRPNLRCPHLDVGRRPWLVYSSVLSGAGRVTLTEATVRGIPTATRSPRWFLVAIEHRRASSESRPVWSQYLSVGCHNPSPYWSQQSMPQAGFDCARRLDKRDLPTAA
jgi:hypothetical protein